MKKHVRKRLLLLVAAMSLLISLCACGGDTVESDSLPTTGTAAPTGEPSMGGSVTVAIAQDLDDSLDPHLAVAAGTEEVLFNLFEGLVKTDPEGNLIVCEHATSMLSRCSVEGKNYEILSKECEGIELNSPNDVVCRSDGIIYFTDPDYGRQDAPAAGKA